VIALRLVDARQRVALKTYPKTFKTLHAAWLVLKKLHDWKHGGIRMEGSGGAHFHVWAEAYNAGGVQERWIFLEVRTIEAVVGPNGHALPHHDQIVAGRMEWIAVTDDVARGFLEPQAEALPVADGEVTS
jgi:hypothetical protein